MTNTHAMKSFQELPKTLCAWDRILADNVHLRVGNRPPALGKLNALHELEVMFQEVGSFGARYLEVLQVDETIVFESTLHRGLQETSIEVPCVLIARSQDGLMSDMRFYFDRSAASSGDLFP